MSTTLHLTRDEADIKSRGFELSRWESLKVKYCNLLLFWDCTTQFSNGSHEIFRSRVRWTNQDFILFVSSFGLVKFRIFQLEKHTVFREASHVFFCVLGFSEHLIDMEFYWTKDVEMQEAHQHAQQNKPTAGSITGSGEECWEDFFSKKSPVHGCSWTDPEKPEYLIALASKLLNGVRWDSVPFTFLMEFWSRDFWWMCFFLKFGITPVTYWFSAIYKGYDFHL